MNLASFLSTIHGSGQLTVARDFEVSSDGLIRVLHELDEAVRVDGPAGLPELDLTSATWAIERVHAACVLLAHRDLGIDEITRHLDAPFAGDRAAPASHYSVDLTMRYLPDVWRLARGMAPADPLLVSLRRLAVEWPLSSVGMPDVGPVDAAPLLGNPGLRRVYVDRILRHQDTGRSADARVAAAVEAAIGEHREFARSVLAVHDRIVKGTQP